MIQHRIDMIQHRIDMIQHKIDMIQHKINMIQHKINMIQHKIDTEVATNIQQIKTAWLKLVSVIPVHIQWNCIQVTTKESFIAILVLLEKTCRKWILWNIWLDNIQRFVSEDWTSNEIVEISFAASVWYITRVA